MLNKYCRADFAKRMQDKNLVQITAACHTELAEATRYEPADQIEVSYLESFITFINNLAYILAFAQKPTGIENFQLQKTKPVVERLVAHKELDAGILNLYLD